MAKVVDLAGIQPVYGGVVTQLSDAVVLVTPSQQWSYAAELSFELPGVANTGSAIRIQIAVPRGTIGIGWLKQDEKDWVCQAAADSLLSQEIELIIPSGTFGGKLVFSNWSAGGKPAVGIVESIQIEAIQTAPEEPEQKPRLAQQPGSN